MAKSLINHAYDILTASKQPMAFKDLFDQAIEASKVELSGSALMSKMASFYTQLTLDSTFALLQNNMWDLRSRHTFDQVHINLDEAYSEDSEDEEDIDIEEKELLKEELGEDEEDQPKDDGDEGSDSDDDFDKPKKEPEEEF